MTPEEAKKKLEELGIDLGAWAEKEAQGQQPAFLRTHLHHLRQLKKALEGELEGLQQESRNAREKLLRIKHGGGS